MHHPEVVKQLNRLAELREARHNIAVEYAKLKEEAKAPVQDKLDAIQQEFEPIMNEADNLIDQAETSIRAAVREAQESVTGDALTAAFSIRRTWNSDKLEGMIALVPAIQEALTQTPVVTIKANTKYPSVGGKKGTET